VKKLSWKGWVKKLDKVFSIYIRTRDCLYTTGTLTEGGCITCRRRVNIKNADAGHFRGRQHFATRWNEQNVNLQCKACNNWGQGMAYEYGQAIAKKFGDLVPDLLVAESKKNRKYYAFELEAMVKYYENRLNDIYQKGVISLPVGLPLNEPLKSGVLTPKTKKTDLNGTFSSTNTPQKEGK